MSNELSKRQIRAKIYYLKKTGQTNKYKRYLKQYRDYNSEDEEDYKETTDNKPLKPTKTIGGGIYYSTKQQEEEPEETEELEEEPEEVESNFLLPEMKYNEIHYKLIKSLNPQEIDLLQTFFNKTTEKGIQTLWKFFKDRQTSINEDEEIQAKNPIIQRNSYFLGY
jgi:hypothetical protein